MTVFLTRHRIFIMALLAVATVAFADSWYVDKQATGQNDGTSWNDAWPSVSTILWGKIEPGDTLYISGGETSITYTSVLSVQATGTADAPIEIRVGQDSGHDGLAVLPGIKTNRYVFINGQRPDGGRGIRVSGGEVSVNGSDANNVGHKLLHIEIVDSPLDAIRFVRADGVEIGHNYIENAYRDAMFLGGSKGGFGNNRIHDNYVNGCGDDGIEADSGIDIFDNVIYGGYADDDRGHPDGLQLFGSHLRVHSNTIVSFYNAGIFIDVFGAESHDVYVYNNVVDTTLGSSTGITLVIESDAPGADGVLIANNTIVDAYRWGVFIRSKAPGRYLRNTRVLNNIVYNCFWSAPLNDAITIVSSDFNDLSGSVVDYNQVVAGPSGSDTVSVPFPAQFHAIEGEPMFVQYTERGGMDNDYRLTADSPSIGAATELSGYFDTDYTGSLRQSWDAGAFEFNPAAAPPQAPPAAPPPQAPPAPPPRPSGLRINTP